MKTKDFKKFKKTIGNRNLNEGLIKRIMDSIKEIGFVESRPIIIDSEFNVIDGQHRLEACIRLDIDAHYVIEDLDADKAITYLNMNQGIWRLNDWINKHSEKGIACYEFLKKFNENNKLGISNAIMIVVGSSSRRAKKIRNGEPFDINKDSNNIALFINECKKEVGFATTKSFVHAITVLFKKSTPEQRAVILYNIGSIRQMAIPSQYISIFENLINKRKSKNMVSFQ